MKRNCKRLASLLPILSLVIFSPLIFPFQSYAQNQTNSGAVDTGINANNITSSMLTNTSSFTPISNISGINTGLAEFNEVTEAPTIMAEEGFAIQEPLEPNETQIEEAREVVEESISEMPTGIESELEEKTITVIDLNQNVTGISNSTTISNSSATAQPGISNSTTISNSSATAQPSINATVVIPDDTEPQVIPAGQGFEGRNQANSGNVMPSDATIAAGPNHVVQMVNVAGQISTKSGQLLRSFTLLDFFRVPIPTAPTCAPCDPFLVYDKASNRYFASVLDVVDGSVRVAVSQNEDPMGNWFTYRFRFSPDGSYCPDQPYLAVSSDKVAIGANVFSNHCKRGASTFLGAQDIILKKIDLMNNAPNPQPIASQLDRSDFSNRPAKSFGTDEKIIMVSVKNGFNINAVKMVKISGTFPNVQRSVTAIPITPLTVAPGAIQPETANRLDTTGRLQSAALNPDNNRVWLTSMDGCRPSAAIQVRSCIRLIEIDINSNQKTQDFDVSNPNIDFVYPSLAVTTSGSLIVTFGASSATMVPGIFATGQSRGAPPNTVDPPITLKAGVAPNLSARYGDYFGASIEADPTDPDAVWTTAQYMLGETSWSAFISEVRLLPPTLTGIYTSNDGGKYYVSQRGSTLWWAGLSNNGGGQIFTNVFRGNIVGNTIAGEWSDVPKGTVMNHGTLQLVVDRSPAGQIIGFHKAGSTGGFSASTWQKTS